MTQELYILGARCFAEKRHGENKFLDITPEEYRTPEFYFALCLNNKTTVMEDIPESILTTNFLVRLLNDNTKNIQCFSESALEKEAEMKGRGIVKFWQAAVINDGYQIGNIPLKPENRASKLAGMMTLAVALSGMNYASAIDLGTDIMNAETDRQSVLPIHYDHRVPKEYSKKYDREEYLLEIYKKIGIQVSQEVDDYYYSVILPENVSIVRDDSGYCVKDSNGETLLHYYDRGPFWDRTVRVDKIKINLE